MTRHSIVAVGQLIKSPGRPLMLCPEDLLSFPPHPGGGIEVVGIDLDAVQGVQTHRGVTWSDETLLVRGHVEADRFIADEVPRPVDMLSPGTDPDLAEFASIMAHELRSPLQIIFGFAKLLEGTHAEVLDDSGKELVGWIVQGATRLNGMIDAMLAYARAGTGEQVNTTVELADVVREVLASMPLGDAEVTWGPLPAVEGDPHQLRQLLGNLLSNGCKFVVAGTTPRVHLAAQREADGWQICVSDNGIGIDGARGDEIFDAFSRLNGRGEYEGAGLGLAIAKRIATRQGGRLWVEPNPGGGSRFCFTIR